MSPLGSLRHRISTVKGFIDMFLARLYPSLPIQYADLHGKRVIITGANSGLGLEMAKHLAAMGAELWLFCRTEEKARTATEEIREASGNQNVFYDAADFSSMEQVRALAKRWIARGPGSTSIDILINNAGMGASVKCTTAEGFEIGYASSFLSQFLLTTLLLNQGCFSPEARIVQITSFGMLRISRVTPDNLNSNSRIGDLKEGDAVMGDPLLVYLQSKAVQTVWTKELQDRLNRSDKYKGIVTSAAHPGTVWTPLWTRPLTVAGLTESFKNRGFKIFKAISISIEEGVKTPLYCALSSDLEKPGMGGKYWDRCVWRWTQTWMEDQPLRNSLWAQWETDANVEATF